MKKILFIITKSNFGGAQRYLYDLATHLPKNEYDIEVALGGNGSLVQKLETAGIKTITIPHLERDIHILKECRLFFALKKIIQESNPDIVHLNSSKIGGIGSVVARIVGVKKIVFTVHGWAFLEKRNVLMKMFMYVSSWATAFFSTHIITVSENDLVEAVKLPLISPKKMFQIHNGISGDVLLEKDEARNHIHEKTGIDTVNTLLVGTIGELVKNKNHSILLDVLENIHYENFALCIIGEGDERKKLEEKIEKSNLQDKVFLLGYVDGASRLLSAFDVFIFPSEKEGLPYALLEAGHAKLPIIASNVGGIPEIIRNEDTGLLIRPTNVLEIKNAVEELLFDKKKRSQYGESIYRHVQENFSLTKMVNETIKVYAA